MAYVEARNGAGPKDYLQGRRHVDQRKVIGRTTEIILNVAPHQADGQLRFGQADDR